MCFIGLLAGAKNETGAEFVTVESIFCRLQKFETFQVFSLYHFTYTVPYTLLFIATLCKSV